MKKSNKIRFFGIGIQIISIVVVLILQYLGYVDIFIVIGVIIGSLFLCQCMLFSTSRTVRVKLQEEKTKILNEKLTESEADDILTETDKMGLAFDNFLSSNSYIWIMRIVVGFLMLLSIYWMRMSGITQLKISILFVPFILELFIEILRKKYDTGKMSKVEFVQRLYPKVKSRGIK